MADVYTGPLETRPTMVPVSEPTVRGEEISSGQLTSATTVYTGPCRLKGVDIVAGAGAADGTIYDNTAATGHIVARTGAITEGANHIKCNVKCEIGIHIVITGTAVNAIVRYST